MSASKASQDVSGLGDACDNVLATLFGLASTRDRLFDCATSERATVEFAQKMIAVDYEQADGIRASLRAARGLRALHAIPLDLGYVREALRIAKKIFGGIEEKKIYFQENHDETRSIGKAFMNEGAIQITKGRANIVATAGSRYPECDVVFALGMEIRENVDKQRERRGFLFTGADLETMTRDEMRRWYPPGFADILAAESKKIRDDLVKKRKCHSEQRLNNYLADHNMNRRLSNASDVALILDLLDQASVLEKQQSRPRERIS